MTKRVGTSASRGRGGIAFLLALGMAFLAMLALSGNAFAETGVQCAPTGMESVTTDQESYPPGETVYISGGGFGVACDVELRITRPDGVVETAVVSTDVGGGLAHAYVLPPPPGVLGIYTLEAVGLGGVVLASHTFTDGPEIRSPDLVPGYVTTGGARQYTVLVRNTGDTTHQCIRVTLPAGYASISVLSSDASQGSFTSSISGQVITFTNSTGINGTTTPTINGWARFDVQATPPNNGPNGTDWTFRAWSNTGCSSNQTSIENVRIVAGTQPTDRRYTAESVDAGGNPSAPFMTGSNVTFRLRMTKHNDGQSNKISYFSVGLPRCLTGVSISSAGENSSNGSDWTAEMFGEVVRWSDPSSGELDDGQSVTLTLTANTNGCALATSHAFASTGWEDAAGSAGNAPSKLFTATASAAVTFIPANVAPVVAATNPTVTVNEGQTATNSGTWADANTGDTVTLSSSVGTVTQSGTNAAGTWTWSYGTTDGPAQTQVVTITANDGTTSTNTTFQLNVNNVAPTATFNAPAAVDEGSTIALSLTSPSDPSPADTAAGFEYRFSCDDGTTWSAWSSTSTGSCSTNDNGTKNVKGEIRDKDGGVRTYSASVTVNNVAPTATFNAPASVNEGSSIALSLASPSDPSSVDTSAGFEYRFSCDNGTTWTAWSPTSTASCSTNDNGTKNVKGEIRDKDGGASTYSASVTVDNVAPTAAFNAPESVNEGSSINLSLTDVIDPGSADTHEYRFSCDGGTTWTAWGESTHACPTTDNGTVQVRGQVRDDDGGVSEVYSDTVTVNNVAPTATFNAPDAVNEGSSINLSLTDVVDPASADTHEYHFSCDGGTTWTDWGSTASHSCSTNDNGTRSVKGQVRDDDDGTSAEYSASVTVNNVAPTATFNAPESVNEGSSIALSLTNPSDPSSVDTAAGFEYRFSCDDGDTWSAWSSNNSASCSTTDNGTRSVKGEIRDKDGGVSTYRASVTVDNVAPTATFNAPEAVNEGSNINLSLTDVVDPGSADTHEYRFSCDGTTWTEWGSTSSHSCATNDNGTVQVRGQVRDDDGGVSDVYSDSVTVNNVAPTATFNAPESVNEGSDINL
ncbi:MAG TPA: hypothetical protein VG144_09585, partial [Gaiellaceae bacterium]|nr:hypothetical protein [Gaiellaceae bacterium]